MTEIRTTARLQHPHILPLLDSGDADGLLYYVMPLVTGETLRARLERERQLPVADAVRIAREVASALDYAHRQNVIHRDITPENILLHNGSALVADFGIALAVQSAGGQRMTHTGLSLGTPQYMSPEQAVGERAIDARSDVYALGAVTSGCRCTTVPRLRRPRQSAWWINATQASPAPAGESPGRTSRRRSATRRALSRSSTFAPSTTSPRYDLIGEWLRDYPPFQEFITPRG